MYTNEEYKEFLVLVAEWAGGYNTWRINHPHEITLEEWYFDCEASVFEYRVYAQGVGLNPGYSHMFSHQVTQEDINMYLFKGMNK